MSFALSYHRLFNVSVRKGDSDTSLTGMRFVPAPRTQELFRNYQIVFRDRGIGFNVYYRTNPRAADPVLGRINSRVRFSFFMFTAETDFFDRYEPDLTPESGPQLYLDNLSAAGSILPEGAEELSLSVGDTVQLADAMKVYPSVFEVSADMSGGSPPTEFKIIDKFDSSTLPLTAPISVAGGGSQGVAKVDASDRPPGPYTLDTDATASVPRVIYIDNDAAAARVLGVLDIHWEKPQDAAPVNGAPFVMRFRKR
ncbi:MAG TPA: hypothetical protein VN285_10680 [Candidatus Deferrimicrobium sp.]|nr:hypothetical protein [Candidatus Deferrimicrobium sp.]